MCMRADLGSWERSWLRVLDRSHSSTAENADLGVLLLLSGKAAF